MAETNDEQSEKVGYARLRGNSNARVVGSRIAEHASPATSANFELASQACKIMNLRDLRSRFFDRDLFADPAWDMLLEIFMKDALQQRITVSAAVAASKVPPTTGLRWLSLMEGKSLILRQADPCDGRRIYVSLSASAFTKMRVLIEHQMSNMD